MLIAAATGAAALSDNSFLTHLTTGRRILEGHLPSTDPYSFTAYGHPWVIQSWFASLLYGLTYNIGHGAGLRLMVAVISALIAAVLWRLSRSVRSIVVRLAVVAPAILIGTVVWGPRPLLFGLLGFVLLLLILVEERDPRWLIPIMWIWVNTHGSFPLGIVLIVVYGIGVWFDHGSVTHVIRTFKWAIGGTILGAVSPLGPKLLWFPIALLSKQSVLDAMIEWRAPGFQVTWQRMFLLTIVAAFAFAPRLPEGRRYRVLLPAVVFVALGLTAVRNIGLATFVLTPLLAAELHDVGSLAGNVRSRSYTVMAATLAAVTIAVVGVRLSQPSFDLSGFPVTAIDWLQAHGRLGPDHRLAAKDVVGNYLEFRSEGRVKVFIDDRVDMFPASVVNDERTLLKASKDWQEPLDRWHIDTILWDSDDPLATVLAESPKWKRVGSFTERGSKTKWEVFERVGSNSS